jgi:hypothetical protein
MIVDIENDQQLLNYLRATKHIGAGETPTVRQLKGGVPARNIRSRGFQSEEHSGLSE